MQVLVQHAHKQNYLTSLQSLQTKIFFLSQILNFGSRDVGCVVAPPRCVMILVLILTSVCVLPASVLDQARPTTPAPHLPGTRMGSIMIRLLVGLLDEIKLTGLYKTINIYFSCIHTHKVNKPSPSLWLCPQMPPQPEQTSDTTKTEFIFIH